MTEDKVLDLLAAMETIEDPAPFLPEQLPDTCIQAASLIVRVVDYLEETKSDPVLLGMAISAEHVLDLLIQYNESRT